MMTNEKKLEFYKWIFVYVPMAVGANLLLYFLSKMPNSLLIADPKDYLTTNLSIITGIFIGHFFIKWRIKRKKNIPIADERTILMMKNYLLIVVYIVFMISAMILIILFLSGVETIEIGWIFVYLSVLIILTMIGGVIVSRL